MSKFVRTDLGIKRLVDNSFKAIDEGAYETTHSFTHDAISIKKAITLCPHSPLITEMKFSSPSQGKIRSKAPPAEIATTMIESGAIGLSVLTQPYLFDGSIEYLATIRKAVSERLLKKCAKGKSLIVSESGISKPSDIQYLKKVGADAFLVGTSIMETGDIGAKVAQLYNSL